MSFVSKFTEVHVKMSCLRDITSSLDYLGICKKVETLENYAYMSQQLKHIRMIMLPIPVAL